MPLHETELMANKIGLQAFNTGVLLGLVNGSIAGLTNLDGAVPVGYKAVVLALPVHETEQYAKVRVNKGAEIAKVLGVYTEGGGGTLDLANDLAGMRLLHTNAHLAANPVPLAPNTMQGSILAGE